MFNEFQLAAIISKKNQSELLQIPLAPELRASLSDEWKSQYDTFVTEIEEIIFEPGFQPGSDERFRILGYELPDWLATEDCTSIPDLEEVRNNEAQMNRIKGIAAFVRNEHNEDLILFQNFIRSQVIQPKLSLSWDLGTFRRIAHPGLMLGKKLSAVYQLSEQKLLFHSFYNVNIFLPLSEYFRPASEEDIRRILRHDLFLPEDVDASATNPSQWFRTRFAMLERSGILDEYTAIDIELRATECKIPIQLSEDKSQIIFPSGKPAAKKLLQFLNEERFVGPVTGTLFETNSKKEID